VVAALSTLPGGEYALDATTAIQNGSTGPAETTCWLETVLSFRSSPIRALSAFATANGHFPATVADSGTLPAGGGEVIELVCEVATGSGVRVDNVTVTAMPVTNHYYVSGPRNKFRQRALSKTATSQGTRKGQ
jgi:hypothetical protein